MKTFVNDTIEAVLNTSDVDGGLSLILNLQPASNKPTVYRITASFDGDEPSNATAYAYTPNGTRYAVCTTIQFGYKPSTNSTILTVEPQATHAETSTKTPEQMQQEAEQNGYLEPPQAEFNLWYPWFRLHFIGKYNGQTMIDVGVAILPFADTGFFPDTQLKRKTNEQIKNILSTIVTGMIIGEAAVWIAGNIGPWAFAAAIISYIIYKGLVLANSWNSIEKLWESLIANFITTAIAAFSGLEQFLPSTFRSIAAGVANIKNWAFAFIYKCIMIPLSVYLLMTTWNRLIALGAV